ncbi:XylR N-terminal domain-containing protein [Gemmobacter serpentinus]|uniref:XylR N-terminal domain-containing protein n=1 Tax=Gemmobacter serpentinus TaxID=2652247 RepID=UPI00124D658F|nr:XylR N-terminal domain-containing protein [Gemmobacter serpentinus]
MKRPLLPIRGNSDSAALLDRGGRPTLREFLAGLEFDPASGTLHLNGARVTLQLAEAEHILRRELVRQIGEDEARIFLLRRGFRMGRNDAAFVASSWPMLDRGDAFTAGTRLHMFSGIVRVETVHNDFDFARGRFSAEFLWHNSLEASEAEGDMRGAPMPGQAARPVCWQQLGYASGYASHFFGALVVYKETACAAQGHRACRVIGKLAEGWGEDDPDVVLFRSRILPASPGESSDAEGLRKPARISRSRGAATALLAPVLEALDLAARLPLPCLIAGAGSCGQEAAANHLLARNSDEALRLVAASCNPESLREAMARAQPGRKRPKPESVLIEGVEDLPPATQAELAARLRAALLPGDPDPLPRLVLVSARPLAWLAGHLAPALWARLAPLALELPGLPQRDDLQALAKERMAQIAAQLGLAEPADLPELHGKIADLDQLDGVLTALTLAAQSGNELTPADLDSALARICPARQDADEGWIAAKLAAGGFSLPAHEARIRAMALAQTGGNLSAAARLLGITRPQLAYREQSGRDGTESQGRR